MRFRHLGALLCVSALSFAGPLAVPAFNQAVIPGGERERRSSPKRQQQAALAQVAPKFRRSRRGQAKPKKRSNRLIISRRVRRRHRKAA